MDVLWVADCAKVRMFMCYSSVPVISAISKLLAPIGTVNVPNVMTDRTANVLAASVPAAAPCHTIIVEFEAAFPD